MGTTEQQYMETIFPDWRHYPSDSMTPCIVEKGPVLQVVFLVMGEEAKVRRLAELCKTDEAMTEILVVDQGEPDAATGLPELVIRLEAKLGDEISTADHRLPGKEADKQGRLADALLRVNRIGVFLATNDFGFVDFMVFTWNPHLHAGMEHVLKKRAAGE